MEQEKGSWVVNIDGDLVFLESNDFTHDVRLEIFGDFADITQKLRYAKEIVRRVNYPNQSKIG